MMMPGGEGCFGSDRMQGGCQRQGVNGSKGVGEGVLGMERGSGGQGIEGKMKCLIHDVVVYGSI